MGYTPPFTLSTRSVNLIAEINEMVGGISSAGLTRDPRLRRVNRLKSIQSSLAIENNSLTLDQVTDVIDGKPVFGNPREIQEVKNAFAAYDAMAGMDPISVTDLLRSHGIMMRSILDDAGKFRRGGVGVFSSEGMVHMGPPADRVPVLIGELMEWLRDSDDHPLVKGCVFHYEFEFIHPFSDGNGRMGRMWHTLILSKWRDGMAWVPVESIVREHQQEYYNAIALSTKLGDSGPFIELMLSLISNALKVCMTADDDSARYGLNATERRLLSMIGDGLFKNAEDASLALSVSKRTVERSIRSLREKGLIRRDGSDKNGRWCICDDRMSV